MIIIKMNKMFCYIRLLFGLILRWFGWGFYEINVAGFEWKFSLNYAVS